MRKYKENILVNLIFVLYFYIVYGVRGENLSNATFDLQRGEMSALAFWKNLNLGWSKGVLFSIERDLKAILILVTNCIFL